MGRKCQKTTQIKVKIVELMKTDQNTLWNQSCSAIGHTMSKSAQTFLLAATYKSRQLSNRSSCPTLPAATSSVDSRRSSAQSSSDSRTWLWSVTEETTVKSSWLCVL